MEKENLLPTQNEKAPRAMQTDEDIIILIESRWRRQRSLAIAFTVVAFLYLCVSIIRPLLVYRSAPKIHKAPMPTGWDEAVYTLKTPVPLEAHIMSKCPDAKVGVSFPVVNSPY
jgi:hypothetical protein